MLSKMASFFKKYPYLHKILSFVYNKVVANLISGYCWRCLKYYFGTFFFEKQRLKKYGFKKIKPVNLYGWRWGKGLDQAYRRYYIANHNEKKCFIKVAKNDATIINEIRLNSYFKEDCNNIDFTTPLVLSDENFSKSTVMMAIEFVSDLQDFYIPQNLGEFDFLCQTFIKILGILEQAQVVHADIHKGNLMIKDGKPILLDFGISKIKNMENGIDYKARPGTFFRTEDNIRIYNDAYSFLKMIEKMGVSEEYKNLESFKNIERLIDSNCFTISIV